MGRGLLSDDSIQEILLQAMEEQFSKARPAARHFFEHVTPAQDQERTVVIHSWVVAEITPTDDRKAVSQLATNAVKGVVSTSVNIAAELIFRSPNLLPYLPLWTDGAPLFAAYPKGSRSDRFGVKGGNIIHSTECFRSDVHAAAERLADLDPAYARDERLQLFCAKPLEKKLIKAAAEAGVTCRVFGLYNYKDQRSWVLTRDASACSLLIGRPAFQIPVKENHLVVGARFVVWINNPRLAVYATTEESK